METKIGRLDKERSALAAKIAELEAQRAGLRAQMEADPMRRAAALAPKHGDLQTQIEVFTVKLEAVTKQAEAEQARLNSPAVKAGVKRAEKIIADGRKLHSEAIAEAAAMIARIDAALASSQEAAGLLATADKSFLPYSGPFNELAELRQMIGAWIFARSERANMTAGFKQAEAATKAREEAKAKEAAAAQAKAEAARAKEAARHNQDKADERRQWFAIGHAFDPK